MKPHEFYEVQSDGRFRFRVDHHTLADFNKCDRYFKFRHIPDDLTTGLVWSGRARPIKREIGSWWSTTMELFYREMSFGVLPSSNQMLKFARDAWFEHKMESFNTGDAKSKEYENFVKFGGLEGGLTMALEYYNAFAQRHFVDWKIIGAELGFGWKEEVFVGEDDQVQVYWGGKPDLVVLDLTQNMVMPLDFKSKDAVPGNASVMFKPHTQTAGYIFAIAEMLKKLKMDTIEHVTPATSVPPILDVKGPTKCIIMVCARIKPTVKPRDGIIKPRFLPVYPTYNPDELEEWRCEIIEKCRLLRNAIERNSFPSRDSACHLFYHGCPFRGVCSLPPTIRQTGLKSNFNLAEPWVPYDSEDSD